MHDGVWTEPCEGRSRVASPGDWVRRSETPDHAVFFRRFGKPISRNVRGLSIETSCPPSLAPQLGTPATIPTAQAMVMTIKTIAIAQITTL